MIQLDSTTGMEVIGKEIILILADGLADELDLQQANWDTNDQEFAARMGRIYEQNLVEAIPLPHLHYGHIPSLIDAEISAFPNAAVMAFQSRPDQDQSIDMYHGVIDTVFIEVMCKSGPYTDHDDAARSRGEDYVNVRTTRTCEAIVSLLNQHSTLNGLVQPIDAPPVIELFDVFKKHQKLDRGPLFFWQGARMEYRVRLLSALGR